MLSCTLASLCILNNQIAASPGAVAATRSLKRVLTPGISCAAASRLRAEDVRWFKVSLWNQAVWSKTIPLCFKLLAREHVRGYLDEEGMSAC